MKESQLQTRYRRTIYFFARIIAGIIFWELILPRVGLRRLSKRTRSKRMRRLAVGFRLLAIQMGGVMIKVGQFLSARVDVLPQEITEELSGLQDEVPPERFLDIREIAEGELGISLDEAFEFFDTTPLAAASLGQVHRARLKINNSKDMQFQEVVVKIQRPNIDSIIEIDLLAIKKVGTWIERYKPIRERVDVRELINEFASTIYEEIDYMLEGNKAEIFYKNFESESRIQIPRVVWSHTSKRVLTLEDVYAIKITDYERITQAGIERADVAKLLFDTYMRQLFEDGIFHADPHPGNLFVTPGISDDDTGSIPWRLTFVDFGMTGAIPDNLNVGLRELVISIGTRDAARMVQAYQSIGVLLPDADLRLIEEAESRVFARFWGKDMSELRQISREEMFQFANQFRDLIYSMPFQIPHDLLLLGRTVAILSGMCTGLDPKFNIWFHIEPYARKMVEAEMDIGWEYWIDELGNLIKALLVLPHQYGRVMDLMERGELEFKNTKTNQQIAELTASINRLAGVILFSALTISTVILYGQGETAYSIVLLSLAILVAVITLFFRRKR